MNKRQSWNIATLFCLFIFGFTAASLVKPVTEYSETENRTLASMPEVRLEDLLDGSFEEAYEEYLTDQFVARDGWIGLKTAVERATLHSESKDIYFAGDGYLIEKHSGSFDSDTAAANIEHLAAFVRKYEDQFGDGRMTVMVIPNAVEILQDKLPAFAPSGEEGEYLEKAAAALPEGVWFDAASVLEPHREEELYYRTDHHWETLAAFLVYQKWAEEQGFAVPQAEDYEIETVTEEFEGTIQSKLGIRTQQDSIELYLDRDDPFYTVEKNGSGEVDYTLYDYTALETKSKYDIFFGGNEAMVTMKTRAGTGRKLLMIKDSYAHCFAPFLITEFDEIDLVDIRYYNQNVSSLIEERGYTDFLFLYNASGFAEDTSISRLAF